MTDKRAAAWAALEAAQAATSSSGPAWFGDALPAAPEPESATRPKRRGRRSQAWQPIPGDPESDPTTRDGEPDAEDVARQRSNPAAKARAQETVDSLLAAIAKYEKQAEKARAANNAKQIADAEASIAARREWLAEAEKMLAEFN